MDEQNLNSVKEEKDPAFVAIGNADLLKNITCSNMITQISAPVATSSRQSEAPVFKRKLFFDYSPSGYSNRIIHSPTEI